MRTVTLFAAMMLVVVTFNARILSTELRLPSHLVTKWTNGVATSFMTRDQWMSAAVGMVSAVGVLLAGAAALARRFPRTVQMGAVALAPRAQVWLRERRNVALAALHVHWGTWFHWITLQANGSQPPQLNAAAIAAWVATQLTVVAGFTAYMFYATTQARRMRG